MSGLINEAVRPTFQRTLFHIPARPSWDCEICGDAWPCSTTKALMRRHARQDRTWVRLYLAGWMHTAVGEMALDGLYERFVGWL